MNDLISIIVPVYNVEKYINKCLQSILNQTYSNLEIILIDDGSTDKSGEICEQYAQKDNRIAVIHKKNGGLSDARNYGIRNATGTWILFVDSDDFIRADSCELLLETAKKSCADIVIGSEKKFIDENKIGDLYKHGQEYNMDSEEAIAKYFYRKISGYACGKLIKKEIVQMFPFPKGKTFEDTFVVYRYLDNANIIISLKDELYFYRQRKGSIVNSKFSERQLTIIESLEEAERYFADNKKILVSIQSKKFIAGIDLLGRIPLNKEWKETRRQIAYMVRQTQDIVLTDPNNSKIVILMSILSKVSPLLVGTLGRLRCFVKVRRF